MDTYDDEYFVNDDEVEFDWDDDLKKKEEKVDEDEDNFNFVDAEEEYRPERNVGERVGFADELIGIFSDENVKTRDPVELFRRKIRAISLSLKEQFSGLLTQKDINTLIITAGNIKYVDYKNPYGYVLGYIASNAGTKITDKNVQYIFNNVLPFINSESEVMVKQADVIRYARFWLLL